ncbi:hypothetical protein NPIL_547821 [Nephila pilipes]|uniref:Uncharacterized protein n=1 Tax=Nephila pilipes TaxID=299642 RepID=A0A8X6PR10_NEPPI|nr:hypothetical protein NPIL_547821 [Nephila pilipes]
MRRTSWQTAQREESGSCEGWPTKGGRSGDRTGLHCVRTEGCAGASTSSEGGDLCPAVTDPEDGHLSDVTARAPSFPGAERMRTGSRFIKNK